MILDTSVIAAIAFGEPDLDAFYDRIDGAEAIGVGAPTVVEASIVVSARLGDRAYAGLEQFLARVDAEVIEFGTAHWREAVSAWRRFGRGRHPARLNFGDCLAYATARVANEPLLAKGGEFALTDVELA